MRSTSRLLATATDAGASKPFRPAPMALLPPIPLYRRLLRAHRKRLSIEQRLLGDAYIKSEFRAHKDVENPVQIVGISRARERSRIPLTIEQIGFLSEWQLYAQMLDGDAWKDAKMDKAKIDKMSDQQIGQLYELMQAIQKRDLEEDDPDSKSDQ